MKIGIFTFHHSLNVGAALQAWALQEYLRTQGFDASLVNYGKIGWPNKYRIRLDSFRHFIGSLYRSFRTFVLTFGIESYRRSLYRRFLRKSMRIGSAVRKEDLPMLDYTHLITGSDMVWNPNINEGDETYFLATASQGVKRISYAPSFGMEDFAPEQERDMSKRLSKFDAISVREPQGAAIVKRLCGCEATVVCDPTLLLPREAYIRLERNPRFALPVKYIAVYTVCGHPWAEDAALKIGAERELPVVHLLGGQLARWYWPGRARRVTAMGPSEWLWFMRHAELVVTNSFHGVVFSLIYHRPFVVALNGKVTDARMRTLLDGTGLESSAVFRAQDVKLADSVDWSRIDRELQAKSLRGEEFLQQALKTNN